MGTISKLHDVIEGLNAKLEAAEAERDVAIGRAKRAETSAARWKESSRVNEKKMDNAESKIDRLREILEAETRRADNAVVDWNRVRGRNDKARGILEDRSGHHEARDIYDTIEDAIAALKDS